MPSKQGAPKPKHSALPPVQVSSLLGVLGAIRLGIADVPSHEFTRAKLLSPLEALERVLGGSNPDRQTITYLLDRLRLELQEVDPDAGSQLRECMRVIGKPTTSRAYSGRREVTRSNRKTNVLTQRPVTPV